jgi:hypothetical protein
MENIRSLNFVTGMNGFIYARLYENMLAFVDTGGGKTFRFRPLTPDEQKGCILKVVALNEPSLLLLPPQCKVFIGQDFFRGRVLELRQGPAQLLPPTYKKKLCPCYQAVPPREFKFSSSQQFVSLKTTINGRILWMLLDTGATRKAKDRPVTTSFIEKNILTSLPQQITDDDGSPTYSVQITVCAHVVRAAEVTQRPSGSFTRWMSSIAGFTLHGALGMNVLSQLSMVVDFRSGLLWIHS